MSIIIMFSVFTDNRVRKREGKQKYERYLSVAYELKQNIYVLV